LFSQFKRVEGRLQRFGQHFALDAELEGTRAGFLNRSHEISLRWNLSAGLIRHDDLAVAQAGALPDMVANGLGLNQAQPMRVEGESGGEDGSQTRLDGFAGRFSLYESKN
jgi:hypothetical protein